MTNSLTPPMWCSFAFMYAFLLVLMRIGRL